MGTWGSGNFDSDTAADFLSELVASIVSKLETAMSGDDVSLEPDEWEGTTVPCTVELLALLARQRWVGVTLPLPATVAAWSTRYLAIWDAAIDELGPGPDWKSERRAVLVRTFDELRGECERAHGDTSTSSSS